jgi:hypothetical protein
VPGSTLLQVSIEACGYGAHDRPLNFRDHKAVAIEHKLFRLGPGKPDRLGEQRLRAVPEPLDQLVDAECEVAHEPLDEPACRSVFVTEFDPSRDRQTAAKHRLFVGPRCSDVLRVTLPEPAYRGWPQADQRFTRVIRVALKIASEALERLSPGRAK